MWFDDTDPLHQRAFNSSNQWCDTEDGWATHDIIGWLGMSIHDISPNWGDNNKMLVGSHVEHPHRMVMTVEGETTDYDEISSGIDSDANLCSYCPLWGVPKPHRVFTYDVEFEEEPVGGALLRSKTLLDPFDHRSRQFNSPSSGRPPPATCGAWCYSEPSPIPDLTPRAPHPPAPGYLRSRHRESQPVSLAAAAGADPP